MKFSDFMTSTSLVEGWVKHPDGGYSCEMSDASHHAKAGKPVRCPGCKGELDTKALAAQKDGEGDVTHWKGECPGCKAKLTVFND